MKSPFTGNEATLHRDSRSLEYRKDKFEVVYHFYQCTDTQEAFTTTKLDILNITQVHNKYREKYGIPFTDEIIAIREKYGLSAAKMSEVLGLGINVYRQYENGDMPSVATGRLIRLAEDPKEFEKLAEMSRNSFDKGDYERVQKKIKSAVHSWGKFEEHLFLYLFSNAHPNIFNGFRSPNLDRIGSMVQFFACENKPFTTAMNKLMFYADFTNFKYHGNSISGLCYKAVQNGPVPCNYGSIYDHTIQRGFVKTCEADFGDFVGDQFYCEENSFKLETNRFNEDELYTMKKISLQFKNKTTREIVRASHEETAWKDNIDDFDKISYECGFELRNID
jgi:transcriptional regulator with XRE-family HTH domain